MGYSTKYFFFVATTYTYSGLCVFFSTLAFDFVCVFLKICFINVSLIWYALNHVDLAGGASSPSSALITLHVCVCFFSFFFCFWHFVRLGHAETESHFPVAILQSRSRSHKTMRRRSIEMQWLTLSQRMKRPLQLSHTHTNNVLLCCRSEWPSLLALTPLTRVFQSFPSHIDFSFQLILMVPVFLFLLLLMLLISIITTVWCFISL